MAYVVINSDRTAADKPVAQILLDDIRTNQVFIEDITGTRIRLAPHDFVIANKQAATNYGALLTGDRGSLTNVFSATARVIIPTGYKATAVMVYGSYNFPYIVYENEIDDGTTATVKSSSAVANTEEDITDVTATSTNYLTIEVENDDASSQFIWGAYVTIARA
jgi:hypothetical protein